MPMETNGLDPLIRLNNQVGSFLFSSIKYSVRESPLVIALVNLKGGCGKSTIAVNLACELAANGDPVLLLDNDVQGTASHWLKSGRLPVRGEFMPLETDGDGERMARAVA